MKAHKGQAGIEPPPRVSEEWSDLLTWIESRIDFKFDDRRRCYLGLKRFAERKLAELGPGQAPPRKPQPMPKPDLGTSDPSRPAPPERDAVDLKELLGLVVDNPDLWLASPNRQLGGRKPAELIGTAEESKVIRLLQAVDQGLF